MLTTVSSPSNCTAGGAAAEDLALLVQPGR
jgi:hypothetical protein